jgi:hypothetical protein
MLYNWYATTGNPTGRTDLLPGGAGVQTAGSTANPFLGYARGEQIVREVLDVSTTAGVPTPSPVGSVLVCQQIAGNNGAAFYANPTYAGLNGIASQNIPGEFGIVLKPGSPIAFDDLPVGSGVGAMIVEEGPVLALCVAPTATGAITYGTFLVSDGTGNLEPLPLPSAAPQPVITPVGGSATAYSYALVAVSVNGTYSAIGTAGSTSTGAATLSTTAYNVITWTPVADAAGYIVLRTASAGTPATTGAIGYVLAGTSVFNDTGLAIQPNTSATQAFPRTAAPATPTVVQVAGATAGTATWSYKVTAILPNGVWSAESTAGSVTTGAATLSTTNANKITWTNVTGAVNYAIDRTAVGTSPSTTGLIGFVTSGTTGFIDYGLAATTFTAQTSPNPNPQSGVVYARSKGTLAAGTTTPTLTPVFVGSF